jgi:hypothetical protein
MTGRLAEIDEHVLHHQIVPALLLLRREFGYSISEAIDEFDQRYEQLRASRPRDFTLSRDDYGRNFYS